MLAIGNEHNNMTIRQILAVILCNRFFFCYIFYTRFACSFVWSNNVTVFHWQPTANDQRTNTHDEDKRMSTENDKHKKAQTQHELKSHKNKRLGEQKKTETATAQLKRANRSFMQIERGDNKTQ